jgi:hypothetical protein
MEREQHGDHWFVVNLAIAGPRPVWEWKVYKGPGGTIVAVGRSSSQDEAGEAARQSIAGQGA